jgi:hypothetical protein
VELVECKKRSFDDQRAKLGEFGSWDQPKGRAGEESTAGWGFWEFEQTRGW